LREATESGSPARDYLPSLVERLPFPAVDASAVAKIAKACRECVLAHRHIQSSIEPSSIWAPCIPYRESKSIKDLAQRYQTWLQEQLKRVYVNCAYIEQVIVTEMKLHGEALQPLRQMAGTEFFGFEGDSTQVPDDEMDALIRLND